MKFVIFSERQLWGGTIAAHNLCFLLEKMGCSASIFPGVPSTNNRVLFIWRYILYLIKDSLKALYIMLFPKSSIAARYYKGYVDLPVKGCKRKYLPWVDADTIVIYTDVVKGNPLHANHVVRWMLYYNRFPNDDTWYTPRDIFFSYREQFNDLRLNPSGRFLKIFHFDKELYKRTNYGERRGVCYFIRKGIARPDLPTHFDGPVLDHLKETEKVHILNQCERCYIYDTQTFYATIAALCGCLSIVVTEPGKSRKDYIKHDDYVPGVAYGEIEEEIRFAVLTQGEVEVEIQKMLNENEKNVQEFIATCKAIF